MIVEWLVVAIGAAVLGLLGLMPAPTPPVEVAQLPTTLQPVMDAFDGVDNWINVGLLVTILALVGAAWAAHVAIKVVRMLISHVTGGGGAT
jgi:uncharacterized membrane protein